MHWKNNLSFLIILLLLCSCRGETQPISKEKTSKPVKNKEETIDEKYQKIFEHHGAFVADGFDFPVGKPNAKGYYNAQGFGGKSHHLGDDWNATTGGNSDLGHPIYAVAHGYVSQAYDAKGGWGNVIRVVHRVEGAFVESLYAHCLELMVKEGDWVKRGDKIATIGNNNGMYYAHLHLEIRDLPDMPLGGGYSSDTRGYLNPTSYIKKYRKVKK